MSTTTTQQGWQTSDFETLHKLNAIGIFFPVYNVHWKDTGEQISSTNVRKRLFNEKKHLTNFPLFKLNLNSI